MFESMLTEQGLQHQILQKKKSGNSNNFNRTQLIPDSLLGKSKIKTIFPKRQFLNVLLIILTTFQVILIVNSQVYLHSRLVRSFMNFYADEGVYPELFSGNRFSLNMQNISQLQDSLNYIVETIAQSENQTLINMNFADANISLHVLYKHWQNIAQKQYIFVIDPKQGIIEPFDSHNVTSIRQFLLNTKHFELQIANLQIETQGIYQRYIHRVIYNYEQGYQIIVNFDFQVDNALVSNIQIDRPQANFLIYLRLFYACVFILAFISFYSNAIYIQRAFKQLYSSLQKQAAPKLLKISSATSIDQQLGKEQIEQIKTSVKANIQARHITLSNQKWKDYYAILQFDIIFSTLSNIMQMVGNAYLLFGREHQIIVGLSCLLSWLTIFRLLKDYRRLVMMHQLIKMSFIRIIQFLVSFFIIFLGYTFLGMCAFSKVFYFSSLNYTVTTLVCMIAGDSINQFITAICQKNSIILAVLYSFSYVILFMHAIHNTLASIIKQYFILQKIELIKVEKKKKGQQDYIYLGEYPRQNERFLNQNKLKLDSELALEIQRIRLIQPFKRYNRMERILIQKLEFTISTQKWEAFDQHMHKDKIYLDIQAKRLQLICQMLSKWNRVTYQQIHN